MSQAVPAGMTGRYRERPPPAALARSFACLWVHEAGDEPARPILVPPDGAIDLQWMNGSFRIAGPDTEVHTEFLPAGSRVVGFRFRPAAATAWLGIEAHELTNGRVALDDVWGGNARRLAAGINGDAGVEAMLLSLEEALIRRGDHGSKHPVDRAMAAAFAAMARGLPGGEALIPQLTRTLAISERTLRRRFDAAFGYGPKTLDRILRYRRFVERARGSDLPLAMLALEAGYADQAHLSREIRRMSGVTAKTLFPRKTTDG